MIVLMTSLRCNVYAIDSANSRIEFCVVSNNREVLGEMVPELLNFIEALS
jgi:hypothetical protein